MARKAKKIDDADRPWTSNYPELERWLRYHELRCDWQHALGDHAHASYIEQWRAPRTGRIVLVIVHALRHGWDVLVPACQDNDAAATLRNATEALGLVPEPAPVPVEGGSDKESEAPAVELPAKEPSSTAGIMAVFLDHTELPRAYGLARYHGFADRDAARDAAEKEARVQLDRYVSKRRAVADAPEMCDPAKYTLTFQEVE